MIELQKIEKIEIKYQPRNKCFYIFTFLLCSLTDRPPDKIYIEWMLIDKGNIDKKNGPLF